MFPSSVKVFILISVVILLGGCTGLTTKEIVVVPAEEEFISEDLNENLNEVLNKTENARSITFLNPEDIIELKDGRKLVYKGNVSVSSIGDVEWKATFFLNNDPKRRYNLPINNFLLIGGTQIIIIEFVTYQQGSVGVEIKET